MKVLFAMRHAGYVRNFESTLRMLCERGHAVHLAFHRKLKCARLDPDDIAEQLARHYPTFSYGNIPVRADGWGLLGRELRLGLDYLRYLGPQYRDAPKLRERARKEAPAFVLARTTRGAMNTPVGRKAAAAWLRAMDRAIPRDAEIDAYIRSLRPDVLAVTPLIEPGSPQAEYVRSARALGIRTALCVASWDNLTNKGLIHCPVDLVAVWNDAMKHEAVEHHGVAARRVVVTGAAAFDHWFDWSPRTTRQAFCERVGLPAARPYLLYVCSSKFVAPAEAPFVRGWVERIRRSTSATLREVGILVRPHPQNAEQWRGIDLRSLGAVVWPPHGAAPVDASSRSDYFDSIHHSAAVIGVNTTAEIESAIVGRPVFTLLAPEFRDTQEGTLHFRHLRHVNGGLLTVARDFEQHLAQVDAAVREPVATDPRSRRFVEAFVRPYGVDVPATPRLVDALEKLGSAAPPRRARDPLWAPLVRRRLARRCADLERAHAQAAPLESKTARQAARDARDATRRARDAERRERLAQKAIRKEESRARRAEAERTVRQKTLEALVARFRALGEVERRSFLRAAIDAIPADSFVELHGATKARKLDYQHADILLRATTKEEVMRLGACAKEPFTIDWMHRHVAAGDVLYDIGANVGAYSLVAAMKPGGGARVYCFEASYANVASLCANIILNAAGGQVTPLPIALSNATAMNIFSLRRLGAGAARHVLGEPPSGDGSTLYRQPVMMFRLDDVIQSFALPLPNHIKLDVDGGELAVLEGAPRTLASSALRSLLIEVSASLSDPVIDMLQSHGLRLESKVTVTNKTGDSAVWYGVFARGACAGAALAVGDHARSVSR